MMQAGFVGNILFGRAEIKKNGHGIVDRIIRPTFSFPD